MPFALPFHKEILPHPCHYPPSTTRAGTAVLPSMLSLCHWVLICLCWGGTVSAGLGITAASREMAEDDVGKLKSTLTASTGKGWQGAKGDVEKSPLRALNQAWICSFSAGRNQTLHCCPNKTRCINFHWRQEKKCNEPVAKGLTVMPVLFCNQF